MTQPAVSHPSELLPWYVNGTLEGEERHEVEEHLATCLVCRREVDELRELRREVRQEAPTPPEGGLERLMREVQDTRRVTRDPGGDRVERSGRRRFRFWPGQPFVPAVVAATAVVVVGLTVWRPWGVPDPPVQERAGEETEVLRSSLPARAVLPRDAFVLRWEVDPSWQNARFSLTVTRGDLTPVAEAHGLDETSYEVPADALATVPSGTQLLWRVEAVQPDGTQRAKVFPVWLE